MQTTPGFQQRSQVVELLQFIFNLTLTEQETWYKLSSSNYSQFLEQTVRELHHFGLLTLQQGDQAGKKFCVNQLM